MLPCPDKDDLKKGAGVEYVDISAAVLVFCTGNILVEQGKPLKYSEVFQLVASAPGQYYLHNVIFRFNYA